MADEERLYQEVPFTKDFDVHAGNDVIYRFQVKFQVEGETTPAACDLSSCTVKLYVYDKSSRTYAIDGRAVTPDDATDGDVTLLITASDTTSMLGNYTYFIKITWPVGHSDVPEGATKNYLEGNLRVNPAYIA